ncbi:MAG: cyclopropane-fatty-acyl-phospholipid synthase [Solirubrobacteraceae bacterium]|jgi:cyclopropane-fatty-acyl-phospholipid synthase|nr:cyclopropane-fatty-acyl-phospholipid synthase [Solirubrobacteraceae bacterium]
MDLRVAKITAKRRPRLGTALLRGAIERALPERPFHLRLWDGSFLAATSESAPEFRATSPAAVAHFLRSPDQLGLGRAYVEGNLVVDDLDAAFVVVDTWEPPPIGPADRLRLMAGALSACRPWALPRTPELELILDGQRHTVDRDKAAIRYHYDVGNDFFALFLDESMTYSCAIFSRGARTLLEAQRTKLDLVATKLGLEPGDRVLDVGCGWGSFAIHAAGEYGASVVAITISDEQAVLARERVAAAGLSDRIEIRVADYRELDDEPFDAISSIGMVEHVGENQIDRYAAALARMLKPDGVLLNHGIAVLSPDDDPLEDIFSTRYVFPDGEPLPLSRVQLALERAGLETHHVEGFGRDYARTLREWHDRLDSRLEEAERIAGEQRTRIWRLYLRAARHGFEVGFTNVYQVLARPRS